MARVNISIPDDLKERMDESPGLNWSEIARNAFETQLKIHKLKGVDMESSGLERLRASKKDNGEREHAEGVAEGKKWALEVAQYDELEVVATFSDDYDAVSWQVEPFDHLNAIAKKLEWTVKMVANDIFGKEDPSLQYIDGFIDGATEVHRQV